MSDKPLHIEDKDIFGAVFGAGGWYWWDRNWEEHGPHATEEEAERARLVHPDFAVEPEIRNMMGNMFEGVI